MTATKILRLAAVGAVLVPFGACVDLEVTNLNEPERERALSDAADVAALIRSQFRTYWGVVQGGIGDEGSPGAALDAAAEVEASNDANDGTWDMGMIPPTPIVNEVGYRWGSWMRTPWLTMNRGLAALRGGLRAIEDQDLTEQDRRSVV